MYSTTTTTIFYIIVYHNLLVGIQDVPKMTCQIVDKLTVRVQSIQEICLKNPACRKSSSG